MLKILSWNIMYGFHREFVSSDLQEERIELAKHFVKKVDPDVFIINEACFQDKINYKTLFDYPYEIYAANEHEWGNCILSKIPFTQTSIIPLYAERKAILVVVNNICIGTFHPHPTIPEKVKDSSFARLIDCKLNLPFVLMGDFNIVSHRDINPYNDLSTTTKMIEEEFGLIDVFEHNNESTYPTLLKANTNEPIVKLDHCFVSNDITVIDKAILKTPDIEYASDHYPLLLKIKDIK